MRVMAAIVRPAAIQAARKKAERAARQKKTGATGEKLKHKELTPNHRLRSVIQELQQSRRLR